MNRFEGEKGRKKEEENIQIQREAGLKNGRLEPDKQSQVHKNIMHELISRASAKEKMIIAKAGEEGEKCNVHY